MWYVNLESSGDPNGLLISVYILLRAGYPVNVETSTFTFHLHFNCGKTIKLMALTFILFLLTVLWKIEINCMSVSFLVVDLLEVGRKKEFFNIMVFNPLSFPNKAKYSNNKCYSERH